MVKPDFLSRTNAIGIANGLKLDQHRRRDPAIEVQVMDNGSGRSPSPVRSAT